MSTQHIAFKFRMYPNKEQQSFFQQMFGSSRFIYNKILGDKIEHYEKTGENLKIKLSTYINDKENSWIKQMDSRGLEYTLLNLNSAYSNFFKRNKQGVGFPKFKSKYKTKKTYTTDRIKIKGNKVYLPKLRKDGINIVLHRPIPLEYTLKSATISCTPTNKYFISIICEYEKDIVKIEPETFIGLDFSMSNLYVDSNKESPDYPYYYIQTMEKLAKEQRKLSKMKLHSNNYNKQKQKVAKIYEKIANQRKDFLHKNSLSIVNNFDAVCVEDINLQEMSKTLNFGKKINDNSFGNFRLMLEYKLAQQGKEFVKINKWFPSSKMCSYCGNVKDELALNERTYICEHCGMELDRDFNAAINIKNEGINILYNKK